MNSFITKYETSLILGIRMNQLSENAPIMSTSVTKEDSFIRIAATELIEGKLNIEIKRPLPHNRFYRVSVKELKVSEDLRVLLQTFK